MPKIVGETYSPRVRLGRVVGTVVATVRAQGLEGLKLLVVAPLDRRGRCEEGPPWVACDVARAGVGDCVVVVTSREASHTLPDDFTPVDAAVVAVVDEVDRGSFP